MNERLENLKKALSLQWGELAETLGISRSFLDQARKGTLTFGPKTVRRLAELEAQAGIGPPPISASAPVREILRESRDPYGTEPMQLKAIEDAVSRLESTMVREIAQIKEALRNLGK